MAFSTFTAAEAKEIANRHQRLPTIRAVADALRRGPAALPDPIRPAMPPAAED